MKMKKLGLFLLLCLGTLGTNRCSTAEFDRYGGWRGIGSEATGHFRVEQIDGRWWFITPEGNAFFSAGIQNVNPDPDRTADGRRPYRDNVLAKYGAKEVWADATLLTLRAVGLDTIGDFSKQSLFQDLPTRLPYTPGFGFGNQAPIVEEAPLGVSGRPLRDYFAPEFVAGAAVHAESTRGCAEDSYCIGVFSDDELGWGPSFVQTIPYLDGYLMLPANSPGKLAVQDFFERHYGGDIDAFNTLWEQSLTSFDEVQQLDKLSDTIFADSEDRRDVRRAFLAEVAERYFQVVDNALHGISPDLLFLGSRFLPYAVPSEVVEAASHWVDVVSINYFEWAPLWLEVVRNTFGYYGHLMPNAPFSDVDVMGTISEKPILMSSFSYRAADSAPGNSWPPFYPTLSTQDERADAYERYMREVLRRPFIVGAHWFEYADQPAAGRVQDGENNNFGIVDINDDLYAELATRMRRLSERFYARE